MESLDDITNISDMDSCRNYLRDASLYKMMNDPNHRAMLFLLEVLMNCERSMSIEELANRFFSDIVSHDMQDVCGTTASGLRTFLEKYPSLFRLEHGMVSSMDVSDYGHEEDIINGNEFESKIEYPRLRRRPVDLSIETEAVKYFQSQLSRKEERWVAIRSLAGHLSQAPDNIRQTVGSQNYFKTFLQRHPHVFELQGDLVSLRDQFSSLCLAKGTRTRPKSTIIVPKKPTKSSRPTSMIINSSPVQQDMPMHSSTSYTSLAIDSREFQAAMFLRTIIRKKPRAKMSLSHLFLYLAKAPQSIRDCIGWTKVEMQEFLRKQPSLFDLDQSGFVTSLDTEEISVVVNDSPLTNDGQRTIINHKGSVYHVSKLWGIIDLGQHEHVFFDKSIFRHLDDLQRHFKIGEPLYFNAILAPKQSRAKWRATQVWKESDKDMVQRFCGDILSAPYASSATDVSMQDNDSVSCCRSLLSEQRHIIDSYHEVDEELAEILQLSKIDSDDDDSTHWGQNTNYKSMDEFSIISIPSPSPSSTAECASTYSNVPQLTNDSLSSARDSTNQHRVGVSMTTTSTMTVSVATQTLSTGDIMAVHMYHEPELTSINR